MRPWPPGPDSGRVTRRGSTSVSYEVWRHLDGSGWLLRVADEEVTGYARLAVAQPAPRRLGQVIRRPYYGDPARCRGLEEIRHLYARDWTLEQRYEPAAVIEERGRQRAAMLRGTALLVLSLIFAGVVADLCSSPAV